MLAACSGGADSVALVLLLDEIRRVGRIELAVGHVHHGLRGAEADSDLVLVRDLAAGLGLPFLHRRCDAAAAAAQRRRGMEEAARHVRRDALGQMREEAACDVVALAHVADDQAETFLMRLLRGSGAEGLAGMAPVSGPFARPLLGLRRADVRAVVHAAGIAWSSDPTNWAPSSARALVRELLGRLQASLDDRLVERICETAAQLRDESALLDELAARLVASHVERRHGAEGVPSVVVRDAAAWGEAPPALRRRAVRRLLRELQPSRPPPSADALHRAERLFHGPRAPAMALLPGLVLRRAGADVVLGAAPPAPASARTLEPGTTTPWPGGDLVLGHPGAVRGPLREGEVFVLVDLAACPGGLLARPRRPGDVLLGARGRRRVASLLAGAGIPAASRQDHPVVCLSSEPATIVWLAGLGADPRFVAEAGSTHAAELRWTPSERAAGAREPVR